MENIDAGGRVPRLGEIPFGQGFGPSGNSFAKQFKSSAFVGP